MAISGALWVAAGALIAQLRMHPSIPVALLVLHEYLGDLLFEVSVFFPRALASAVVVERAAG